jgi:O-antigen/teichoic acid export membrane protein
VGIYDIALKVALLIQLPLLISNTIFAPMIGELYAQNNISTLEALFKVVTKWVFIASFLIFSLSVLLIGPILKVFGTEFASATLPFFLLALGQLVNSGTGAVGWILIMSGHSKLHLINATLAAFLTIVLCYYLIPKFGTVGTATAVTITLITVNILRLIEVFYILGIHPYHREFIVTVLGSLASLLTAYYLKQQIILQALGDTCTELVVAGIFLVIYSVFLNSFQANKEEKDLIRWATQKVASHTSKKQMAPP